MLDEKELLPTFMQVLSSLVAVDSSDKPPIGNACGIQKKCKKDEDDDDDVHHDRKPVCIAHWFCVDKTKTENSLKKLLVQ